MSAIFKTETKNTCSPFNKRFNLQFDKDLHYLNEVLLLWFLLFCDQKNDSRPNETEKTNERKLIKHQLINVEQS